jgi:hypothetical protein
MTACVEKKPHESGCLSVGVRRTILGENFSTAIFQSFFVKSFFLYHTLGKG